MMEGWTKAWTSEKPNEESFRIKDAFYGKLHSVEAEAEAEVQVSAHPERD